ncbi:MAG: OsmC family protein [Terriglobales bacterium]
MASTFAAATWTQGEQFLTSGTSAHAVLMDSDRDSNQAPGPMEMVLRSLCACLATDIVVILKKTRQTWTSLEVSAEGERASEPPAVYVRIHLRYRIAGSRVDRSAAERAVALSQEKYCSVLAMLRQSAAVTFTLALEEAVAS